MERFLLEVFGSKYDQNHQYPNKRFDKMRLNEASLICKAESFYFLAVGLAAHISTRYWGGKNRFVRICPPKFYCSISAIFAAVATSLDFKIYRDRNFFIEIRIRNARIRCPSCRKTENFVLKNNLSINTSDCTICMEPTAVGQRVAAHSGDGEKHPMHAACFDQFIRFAP